MKRLILFLALGLMLSAQGNAQHQDTIIINVHRDLLSDFPDRVGYVKILWPTWGHKEVIGDTAWYYRRAEFDSATIGRALDSMIEIPGIWQDNDNPLKTLPEGAVYPSPNKLTIDPAMIYHGKVTIDTTEPHYNEFYYLDPQTGYFHRPDGVYEAVPDSEYAGYVGDYDMYYYGRWKHILKWRKVED